MLGGPRLWPAIALGAAAANGLTGVSAVALAGITTGNTLAALAGAHLRVVRFRPAMERVRDVLALILLAAGSRSSVRRSVWPACASAASCATAAPPRGG